jgi:hypothetical protein
MTPTRVDLADGTVAFACPKCELHWLSSVSAALCCAVTVKEKDMSDLPCDVEPSDVIGEPDTDCEHVLRPEVAADTVSSKPLPQPKAPELLGRAAMHMHDRASTYDTPSGERSMGKTVAAFNAVTGRDLTESEGWLLMALLKQVRLFARSEYHQDSAEDAIA